MQIGIVETFHLGVFLNRLRLPPPVTCRALGILHSRVGLEISPANIGTAIVEAVEVNAGDQRAFIILYGFPFYDRSQCDELMTANAAAAPR